MAPDIGTVVCDKNGDIADDGYAPLFGGTAQGGPLMMEKKLEDFGVTDFGGVGFSGFGQSRWIAMDEGRWPIYPRAMPVCFF